MRPVCVLIDGRSGAGKTTFAAAVAELLPAAQVVHLEDVYPGWGGLAAATRILEKHILAPQNPGYYPWDWIRNTHRPERVAIRPGADLIVEGCGAISTGTLAQARRKYRVLSIDIDLPERIRKPRALRRSPEMIPFWDMWAAQEDTHRATRSTGSTRSTTAPAADITITEPLNIDLDIVPVRQWINQPQ